MYLVQLAIEYGAPLCTSRDEEFLPLKNVAPLISSPLTSYLDQILSIQRNRSSAGFSLDIPLIMLVASILKVFYWFGEYYSKALLAQAVVMILVQMALLKVALDNRPAIGAKNSIEHAPFSGADDGFKRPYDFWQWKNTRPYWLFLAYFIAILAVVHLTPISDSATYISILGCIGLAVEAILPVPQILANHRSGSCKGFRLSVLAAWIIGDTMKMSYFFCSEEVIPWAFKLCGMFQCVCDLYLGVQYWMFTRGTGRVAGSSQDQDGRWGQGEKDIRMN
ncbi:hypothetical protein N7462_003709 [Penicillium macrosclerotiorum]|uniref:uncharacterized protein n=1 Tax=Penicillium macrosclerotiorum TaxID=303699 RepID=UPI002548AC71|nr:uncharacterized protein N7462_003709 [Penicillium macrosclerotiorum]KAJ5689317.1 hypothetical protein N7462_003709 [Penicillium macrosclerotiorum]